MALPTSTSNKSPEEAQELRAGGEIFQFIKMDNFCVVFEAFERIL